MYNASITKNSGVYTISYTLSLYRKSIVRKLEKKKKISLLRVVIYTHKVYTTHNSSIHTLKDIYFLLIYNVVVHK